MEINEIYCEDCKNTLCNMAENGVKPNIILTSPPYNTSNRCLGGVSKATLTTTQCKNGNYPSYRYDVFLDNMTNDEYIKWSVELFNKFDAVLQQNGVVLYNISYSSSNRDTMFLVIAEIVNRTNFGIADWIGWKKDSALPNNVSSNKLTRIFEPVFVFARKNEMDAFQCNKKVVGTMDKTGQKVYENVLNIIYASNNDGTCELNKATFSTDLCRQLLTLYGKENDIVYDPFMGTGTTAVAAKRLGMNYIGSELSQAQCEYAKERVLLDGKEYVKKQNGQIEVTDSLF